MVAMQALPAYGMQTFQRKRPGEEMLGDAKRQRAYKTQMCAFFAVGMCAKGADCSYAHGPHELAPASAVEMVPDVSGAGKGFKTQPCKYFMQGTCQKGDGCTYAHGEMELMAHGGDPSYGAMAAPMAGAWGGTGAAAGSSYKTSLCKYYAQGTCTKGSSCMFAHGSHDLGGGAAGGAMFGKGAFSGGGKGFVQEAPAWTLPKFKTVMCKYAMQGSCTKGAECSFAHDESELSGGGGMAAGYSKGAGKAGIPGNSFGLVLPGGRKGGAPAAFAGGQVPGNYKTQLCIHFANNACRKGETCMFAHGEHELRH